MLKQRKQLKVSLHKLLKVIELMEVFKEYETYDEVVDKVASMLGYELLDSEIEDFSSWYLSETAEDEGYDKEHYDNAIAILENFKKEFCKKSRG